jgi:HlyD family secretion protein
VKSPAVARYLIGQGAPIPVLLRLEEDPNTPSGLRWTSSKGAPVPLSPGMLFTASVTVKEQRPISFVFPFIK